MPNGVVTAPPGTYYTDTAGTNGAWRWLKTSGTGNNGWQVVHGDTGWRLLDLINGWGNNGAPASTSPAVRRVGSLVYLRTRNLDPAAATSPRFAMIASGFLPIVGDGGLAYFGNTVVNISILTDGSAQVILSLPSAVGATGSLSWLAAPTWPTALPGTPA